MPKIDIKEIKKKKISLPAVKKDQFLNSLKNKNRQKIHFSVYFIILPILIVIMTKSMDSIVTQHSFRSLFNMLDNQFFKTAVMETDKDGPGILRVGVHNNIKGLGFYNENTKKYYGQEIDVSKAIAEKMGYTKIHFIPVDVSNRSEMLLEDKVDIVAASCTINPSPPQGITFSKPYAKANGKILTLRSSCLTKLRELDGKFVGVLKGSVSADQIERYLKRRNIQPIYIYQYSYDELFDDFFSGYQDAVALDEGMVGMYADMYQSTEFAMDINYIKFDYGIMMKREGNFVESVNDAITALQENNRLKEITDRWKN